MADMSRNALIDTLKASLSDAVKYFTGPANGDYIRFLDAAALDMGRIRPRVLKASVTLVAGQLEYAAPANIQRVTRTTWGRSGLTKYKPWDARFPKDLPSLQVIETETGTALELSREVEAEEITLRGADCSYFYQVPHSIGDAAADTTIRQADHALLILRAQVEACRELAFRNIGKPVTLRDGVSQTARNGTPAALADSLFKAWINQAGGRPA